MKPRTSFAEYCYQQTVGKGLDPHLLDLEQAKLDYERDCPVLKTAVFVDDARLPRQRIEGYQDWVVCRSWAEWVEYLSFCGPPDHVSFDHDLAEEHYLDFAQYEFKGIRAIAYDEFTQPTGLACAQYYCAFCLENELPMKGVAVHCTERPLGALNIEQCLNAFKRSQGQPPDCFLAQVPTTTLAQLKAQSLLE